MARDIDPFRHHPGLKPLIIEPEVSPLRAFDPETLRPTFRERGIPEDFMIPPDEREADRRRTLANRPDGALWVFAYGSLMWDPAILFDEVRRAYAPVHERRMILRDTYGGRGTAEKPGLMAALDDGAGCAGLVFRVRERVGDRETGYLWARERIGPAYHAAWIPVQTDHGDLTALTFVADHTAELIAAELSREEMVTYLAHGEGWLGTSLDYGRNLVRHLEELSLPDPDLACLVAEAGVLREQA